MKPPATEWRAWLYGFAWMAGGIVHTIISVWLTSRILNGTPETAEQRLGIIGIALYMHLSVSILVMLGLGLRNAIRNLKGGFAGGSLEISGHDSNDPAAKVTTTTTTEVES